MKIARRIILPAYFLLCLVLGGASAGGYLANLLLQILAVAILTGAWIVRRQKPVPAGERWLRTILTASSVVFALQFAPLPITLWEDLGQRGRIVEINEAAGLSIAPFVSILPYETLKSLVWLLPSAAVLILTLRVRSISLLVTAAVIVVGSVLSGVLSALQIASGRESFLYFYTITNRGSGVAFFANSNHLATLLLVTIPLTFTLGQYFIQRFPQHVSLVVGSSTAVLLIVFAGLFANNSLAGYILCLPVLGASLAMLDSSGRIRRSAPIVVGVLTLAGLGIAFSSSEGSSLMTQSSGLPTGARQIVFAKTITAAVDNLPFGSGIGTFEEIYRQYEDAAGVDREFINHAHSDYLEIFLELGFPGAALVAAFLAWWTWRAGRILNSPESTILARAGIVVSAAILLHSLVDYPLRTAAISAVFAFSIALMARWTPGDPVAAGGFGRRSRRNLSRTANREAARDTT